MAATSHPLAIRASQRICKQLEHNRARDCSRQMLSKSLAQEVQASSEAQGATSNCPPIPAKDLLQPRHLMPMAELQSGLGMKITCICTEYRC